MEDPDETFSIFIMKSSPQGLRQAETYLRNRKWQVASGVNLKEVLAYVIQKQPEIIMICADHPNRKVKILPKLLAQAFPIRVIAYAESASPSSMGLLRDMAQPYTLFPPVSGPAIERMCLKMRKDLETESRDRKLNPGGLGESSDKSSGIYHFQGEVSSEEAKKSFEQARFALQQLAMDREEAGPNLAYMPNHEGQSDAAKGAAFVPGQQSKDFSTDQEGPRPGESFEAWDARMREALAFKKEGRGTSDENPGMRPPIDPESNPGDHSSDWESGGPGKKNQTPVMESDYIPKARGKRATYIRGTELKDYSRESIVVRGAIEALDQSVVARDDLKEEEIGQIEQSTNLACIVIESPRFSGYLIAALGKNRKIDESFIELIRNRLYQFLKANGEQVKDEEGLSIKIQEVEFEDWALEEAEFLRKSVHDGDEIAMAFFPHQPVSTKLEASASEKMVMLSLDDLKEDVTLEFDLYMYMPENNKYLLYTPEGMPFYGKQKDRLKEKGVTHMHLRKDSVSNVKKYKAQNYLNEKILAYKSLRESKRGVKS